jgi:hypothetical protein
MPHQERQIDNTNDFNVRDWARGIMAMHACIELGNPFEPPVKQRSLKPQILIQEKLGLIGPHNPLEILTEEPSPIKVTSVDFDKNDIPIDEFLGLYFPDLQEIRIYVTNIQITAQRLNILYSDLKYVVRLHEYAHAVVHLGLGVGQQGKLENDASISIPEPGDWKEFVEKRLKKFSCLKTEAHELLAQTITWCLLKADEQRRNAMLSLMKRQSNLYRLSDQIQKNATLEGIRILLELIWQTEMFNNNSDGVRYLRSLFELEGFQECVYSEK